MYAVIETGSQQFKVAEGELLKVEKLEGNIGDPIILDKVLIIRTDADIQIGTPYILGAKVETEIVAQDRSKKVIVFKFKRRKGYKKLKGHRQNYTALRIKKILF